MGCGLSLCRRQCRSRRPPFDCVRVVHINGYVEDFFAAAGGTVTAGDVAGRAKPARHVLCSPAHLLPSPSASPSAGPAAGRAFRADDVLQPGRVYFLLPHAALLSAEASPLDLACLLNRLTAVANRAGRRSKPPASGPGSGPGPVLPRLDASPLRWTGTGAGPMTSRRAAAAWRPRLDRIDERSLGRSRDSMRSTAST